MKNAVSATEFSAAICCIISSGSQCSSGQTAAGLPLNILFVKASTWNIGNCMSNLKKFKTG
jgi:hypothetical protein